MTELIKWLNNNQISFQTVDNEVVEIDGFGKLFLAKLSETQPIFRGTKENPEFNLMENPAILMEEGIFYTAFPFGKNFYYYDLREEFRFNLLKYIGKRQPGKLNLPFVNLGIHTPCELLNGSGDISLWVKKALWMGHAAIGICDRNTMAATLNLQKECAKAGIKHVFGYSFTLEENGETAGMKIYVRTQTGLQNLLRIQKEIMVDSVNHTLTFDALLKYAGGNVLVFETHSSSWMHKYPFLLERIVETYEKVFYQVDLSEYKADRIDRESLEATKYFFDTFYNPETNCFKIEPILICDNYYPDRDDAGNKTVLNKIAGGAAHRQSDDQYFKGVDELFISFKTLFDAGKWDVEALFKKMCSHTVEIAENAAARFEPGKMYMPEYAMLNEETVRYHNRRNMFLRLLDEGLHAKIPLDKHDFYRKRMEEEIYIIESTNNVDYFLIQWDLVREAHRRDIATGVGRGSAGGSLVSFLLGITSIDPVKYGLLFSRFLVPERCGLTRTDEITHIGKDVGIEAGAFFVEVRTDEGTIHFNTWANLHIQRNTERISVYPDELREGDEILLDSRDKLWNINDIIR
jgi:DNA polymerase-3 subunit alpha